MRRIVRPGGVAVVVTNDTARHRREISELVRAATGRMQEWDGARFDAATAARLLPAAFDTVTPHDLGRTGRRARPGGGDRVRRQPAAVGVGSDRRVGLRGRDCGGRRGRRAHVAAHGAFTVTSAAVAFHCT
ncbi:MAG TPA: hypothetical protein VI011_24920 [Asanoa sp.]